MLYRHVCRFCFVCLNGVLTPLSAIFQLYHGVQFLLWNEMDAGVLGEKPRVLVGKLAAVRIEPAISVLSDDPRDHQ